MVKGVRYFAIPFKISSGHENMCENVQNVSLADVRVHHPKVER